MLLWGGIVWALLSKEAMLNSLRLVKNEINGLGLSASMCFLFVSFDTHLIFNLKKTSKKRKKSRFEAWKMSLPNYIYRKPSSSHPIFAWNECLSEQESNSPQATDLCSWSFLRGWRSDPWAAGCRNKGQGRSWPWSYLPISLWAQQWLWVSQQVCNWTWTWRNKALLSQELPFPFSWMCTLPDIFHI